MKNIGVLLQKEWRENTRNFKILWIPLVFIIFGVLEPITNHYLPEIMKSVGNMPEDSEFIWPEFAGEDIFVSVLAQYQFIGLLVLVLAFMGSISGERKHGTGTLLYVRPISYVDYFLSKWLVASGIALLSFWTGIFAAWYYIVFLFNTVDAGDVFAYGATYSVWLLFVITVVLAASAWLPTGGAAGISVAFLIFFQLVDSLIGTYWTISPWKLTNYASQWVKGGIDSSDAFLTIVVTVILILLLIVGGIWMAKRNAPKTSI